MTVRRYSRKIETRVLFLDDSGKPDSGHPSKAVVLAGEGDVNLDSLQSSIRSIISKSPVSDTFAGRIFNNCIIFDFSSFLKKTGILCVLAVRLVGLAPNVVEVPLIYGVSERTRPLFLFLRGTDQAPLRGISLRLRAQDAPLFAAFTDRFIFNAHLSETGAQSYRLKSTQA